MESPHNPQSLTSVLRLNPQRKLRTSPDVEDEDKPEQRTPRAAPPAPVLPTLSTKLNASSVLWYATLACAALTVVYMVAWPESAGARMHRLEAADAHIPRRLKHFEVSKLVVDNMDVVDVAFEYTAPQPTFFGRDRIAAFCVDETTNEGADEPMDEVPTNSTPAGVVRVGPLLNMRCSWLLKFVTGDGIVLEQSPLLRFAKGPTEPTQVHLAPTRDPFQMRVQWVSANVTYPVVRFGMNRHDLTRLVRATQSTYTVEDLCIEPATRNSSLMFRDPGQMFDAVMTRLFPNRRYFYSVGDEDGEMSDVFEFLAPSRLDKLEINTVDGVSRAEPTTSYLVFSNLNDPMRATANFTGATSAAKSVQLMTEDLNLDDNQERFAAAIHVGDLSRAMGSTYVWDQFGHLIEPIAARVPYLVAVGNHDYGYLEGVDKDPFMFPDNQGFRDAVVAGVDSNGECGVPVETRFHMPETGSSLYWYSFDMGLVHHVVLSSEHDYSVGSPMHAWLIADLMVVQRTTTPWVFLYTHRPMYASSASKSYEYDLLLQMRDALEDVIAQYRVDVVFSGHYHSYERSCPVFDEQCYSHEDGRALAPVHIGVGSAGVNSSSAGFYSARWREQGVEEVGYSRVHVYNASHVQVEFVSSGDVVVRDETWIVSDHAWPTNRTRRLRYSKLEIAVMSVSAVSLLGTGAYLVYVRSGRSKQYNSNELRV